MIKKVLFSSLTQTKTEGKKHAIDFTGLASKNKYF